MITKPEHLDETIKLIEEYSGTTKLAYIQASEEIWEYILKKHPNYTWAVAHNKFLTEKTLFCLARHSDKEIRQEIASKNKISEELRELLSNDKELSVRQRIVYNKNTTNEMLIKLSKDKEDDIQKIALQILSERHDNK